jgi:hypothetical protein
MAIFIPRLPLAEARSSAERRVLAWLAGLDDAWTVMHSVGLSRHAKKPWAEADVVVVGPAGAVVIEVKGGRVERVDGLWGFRDRWDRVSWKAEGPWAQAGGAAAALRAECLSEGVIEPHFPLVWAVLLPDAPAPRSGPDILLDVTIDAARPWADPETELMRVLHYWATRIRLPASVAVEDRARLVQHVRGDLVVEPSPRATALRVLEEQGAVLGAHEALLLTLARNPRLLVEGRVDTGLVHLARATSRELLREGARTLLLVPDDPARVQATQVVGDLGVDVLTPYDLAHNVVAGANGRLLRPRDAAGRRALLEAAVAGAKPRYEAAVLASAGALGPQVLTLVDRVLSGGLAHGRWRVFVDSVNAEEQRVPRVLLDAGPVSVVMSRGCRTSQLATATSVLSTRMLDVQVPLHGPAVSYVWWRDTQDHDDLLRELLADRSRAYGADAVALVGAAPLSQARRRSVGDEIDLSDAAQAGSGAVVLTGGPASYESPVVIVHGVQDLSSSDAQTFLYAACGSALVELTILLRQDLHGDFEEAQRAYGRNLIDRMRQTKG